jgi:chromosome segregation ATPase
VLYHIFFPVRHISKRQEELQRRVGELQDHLKELKESHESVSTATLQKRKHLDACQRRLDEVKEASKNCDRAVRIVKDPVKRTAGKDMLRGVERQIRECQDEVRRAELKLNYSHAINMDKDTSEGEYKKEIDRMQDGMKESYARQLETLDRTLDVAGKARDGVESQGQQIHTLAEETGRIGDGLERAEYAVQRFKRQVSSDRICQALTVGNVLVLVVLVVLAILNRKPLLHSIGV